MKSILSFICCLLVLLQPNIVQADRIKDLAKIAGVRDNQLIGYGIVVGLNGTGDQTVQTPFTTQSLQNMLQQLGITLPQGQNLQLNNIAAVVVNANLPAFSKPGQTIDITVSSIGNAKSLRGGSLLMTPLKGIDGRVYAIAQGNLVVGGFGVESADGSSISVNIPSVGRVPNGATVERSVPTSFGLGNHIVLNLHRPDFTSANRMVDVINNKLGKDTATAMDGSSVQVRAPVDMSQRVAFTSMIENMEVNPDDGPARVIVNSRTGTVVIGRHVKVTEAAVSHGSLVVTISNNPEVSQPNPFSDGQTQVIPNQDINVEQEDSRMFLFNTGVSLDDLVQAVNQVGAAPGDLVAILEALKEAGALKAELVII